MEKGVRIGQGRTANVYAWGDDQILKLYQEHMPGHLVEQEFIITRPLAGKSTPGNCRSWRLICVKWSSIREKSSCSWPASRSL